ncbi:type II toxin-antitoxin system VapC family toxin [Methylosinus sp. Sm6]|uniref:type II toxin-antitoxin system VapC family toxin n=1 Tax=Methylosinus sp. Sm6 TaxID=2866948 RepID=UPI001C99E532|nr:type II toxin-antitoxin system VapC family toxin [Methylosinus sp. Sm6]MBY6241296.1 type II toxin-antitoxin system VapC family toxin [Methylosinus sp. Sm6]
MLDTNIVSDMIRNPRGKAVRHIAKIGERGLSVSAIVAAELRYGAAKAGSSRLSALVEGVLSRLVVVPFDVPADEHYGRIRAELEASGSPIGQNDLFIAAHAIALGLPLVTNNLGEFSRVGSLKLENWLG